MDDADYIFLETCKDLEGKVAEGSFYSFVKAAALIRQLLLDETPLMHRVNRTHRVSRPKFVVLGLPDFTLVGLPEPDGQFLGDGIDALDERAKGIPRMPGQAQQELALDKFIAHRVARVSGIDYTVADIVRLLAHVAGGVHLGDPKETEEKVIQEVGVRFANFHPAVLQIRGIANVVLRALAPLRERVSAAAAAAQAAVDGPEPTPAK